MRLGDLILAGMDDKKDRVLGWVTHTVAYHSATDTYAIAGKGDEDRIDWITQVILDWGGLS